MSSSQQQLPSTMVHISLVQSNVLVKGGGEAAGSLRGTDGSFLSDLQLVFCPLQEFHLSAGEQKILQEIEFLIMKIRYKELVTEDGELMVTASPAEAVQPSFETAVKSYRIREGMGVTFHCRTAGMPLPKVSAAHRRQPLSSECRLLHCSLSIFRSPGSKTASGSKPENVTRWSS